MLELLNASDWPRDIIERRINERLKQRLFKMWWETGDLGYLRALDVMHPDHDPEWTIGLDFVGRR